MDASGTPSRMTEHWPRFGAEETAALAQVVESGIWGQTGKDGSYVGRYEPRFERSFAAFHTARHALCVANGTVALQLALESLGIGVGDEVIVPGLTWQATAAAVLDVNAEPILVDVVPDTYCIDPDGVAAAITTRTKAIIAVHLYGCVADLDRLAEIAEAHDIDLIEDCAHSHGSMWRGRGVGSIGTVGCFSFQSTKSLTSGEGGLCMTNSDTVRGRIEALRTCGRRPADAADDWQPIQSGNYRLTEWQAAVLTTQFERFPQQLHTREANAGRLDDAIAQIEGVTPMRVAPEITRRGLYGYVFRHDSSYTGQSTDAFRARLSAELGVTVGTTYEPLSDSPLYRPHSKQRHHLNDDYWTRIDPGRFDLPVAWRAYGDEAVVIPHQVLLNDWSALQELPAAVSRIQAAGARTAERSAGLSGAPS
jgi:L-glutamine:2-deoxy-scyllo-inosose/3-amino-2,3-dideoxy-scyllo-inosose aminotransferase